jgi:hypothetical protein
MPWAYDRYTDFRIRLHRGAFTVASFKTCEPDGLGAPRRLRSLRRSPGRPGRSALVNVSARDLPTDVHTGVWRVYADNARVYGGSEVSSESRICGSQALYR